MSQHIVTLTRNLKGFAKPDPNTYVAEVPAGEYPLFQIMSQYPDPDTDFVQLDIPDTDEDLWICIRWKDRVYATMRTENAGTARPPINFHSDVDLSQAQGPVFHGGGTQAPEAPTAPAAQPAEESGPQLAVAQALKGFQQPDTRSAQAGVVQPGTYPVIEVRDNYPSPNTDFVHIEHPSAPDAGIWICIRWKNQSYAHLIDEDDGFHPEPEPDTGGGADTGPDPYATDPMAIGESALTGLLPKFYPFGYDLQKGYYPYGIPGVKVPQAPPNPQQNNCCTFVEGLVVKAWAEQLGVKWSNSQHADMMIYDANRIFSPAEALIDAGIAEGVHDEDAAPGPWTVIQGWRQRSPLKGGHTFIIVAHHPQTDKVLTLESNSYYKLKGVGYRNIGNIKDFPTPPDRWWERPDVPTWEKIKQSYPNRKQARLKVRKRSFAGV